MTKNLKKIPKFIRVHADKVALDNAQLALYVTVCKLLQPELKRRRELERKN